MSIFYLSKYIKFKKKTNSEFVTSDCWQCPGVRYSWGTWRWTSPTVNTPSWPRGTRVSTSRPCSAGSTVITRTDAPGRRRNVTSPTENRTWERNNLMHVHNKQFLEMLIFVYFFNDFLCVTVEKKPWMIVLTFRVYKQDQEGDAQDVQNSQLSHVR